jgi:hypothetical protein
MIELTIRASTYDNRPTERPSNRDPYTRHKTVHTKPPHAANVALQSSYKKTKCWGCGHGHHLRNGPTTSKKRRQRLWEEYRNRQPPYEPRKNIKTTPTEAPLTTTTNATTQTTTIPSPLYLQQRTYHATLMTPPAAPTMQQHHLPPLLQTPNN